MKCCSRSTLGVVIGGLNILSYIGITTFLITLLVQDKTTEPKTEEQQFETSFRTTICVLCIVVSLLMSLVSGLLIMGIVKKRHKLMKPWVLLSATGIIFNCVRFALAFIGAIYNGAPISVVFGLLLVGVAGLGISALIFWAIYTLYRDIREENIKKPINKPVEGSGIPYQMQNNY